MRPNYFDNQEWLLRSHIKGYVFCGALATACMLSPFAARAQTPDDAKLRAYRQVERACGSYTQRFCPALVQDAAPSARNQVICLKHFKTSLSLTCRSAVTAAGK